VIAPETLRLAAAQHGAISRTQVIETSGVSSATFARTRARGVVVDVVPGVVRFASSPETFLMRCMAVQLRFDPIGFLSGWTAGALVGLRSMPRGTIHVTVPTHVDASMPMWADVHRSRWYDEDDRMRRGDGLIVATPMRMLWGLAAVCNQHRFDRAAEDAWHLGLITPIDAWDYLEAHRCRGKDGVSTLERWLEGATTRSRPSQSNLERVLLEALERCGLPNPVRQHPLAIGSNEVIHLDIAWPELRLGVEPGAAWHHGGDLGQRRDQDRDRACAEAGWLIVRFDETMRSDPDSAADQVARIFRRRRSDLRTVRD
jgi:hypothetical protein